MKTLRKSCKRIPIWNCTFFMQLEYCFHHYWRIRIVHENRVLKNPWGYFIWYRMRFFFLIIIHGRFDFCLTVGFWTFIKFGKKWRKYLFNRFPGLISGIRIRHYAPYALKGADHITSPWQPERLMKNPMYINTRKLLQKKCFYLSDD